MSIVFKSIIEPTAFGGGSLDNGRLGPCDLTSIYMAGVGMVGIGKTTCRAAAAMQVICKAETGYDLTCASAADVYRSAQRQYDAFKGSYRKWYNPLTCVLTSRRVDEDGTLWYKLRSQSAKASIGYLGRVGFFPQSNHGKGIAWDLGIFRPGALYQSGSVLGITAIPAVWQWVQDNADSFGFSWEGAAPGQPGWEPWHIRHVLGDNVSQRVHDVEAWFAAAAV